MAPTGMMRPPSGLIGAGTPVSAHFSFSQLLQAWPISLNSDYSLIRKVHPASVAMLKRYPIGPLPSGLAYMLFYRWTDLEVN